MCLVSVRRSKPCDIFDTRDVFIPFFICNKFWEVSNISDKTRINEKIRAREVRVISADGEQLGVMSSREALSKAREAELDLVEVSPNAKPPVCKIMDYGKYKYELSKKSKAAKKKQHSFQMKEMRYRPKIDVHDFDFKTKHVREFLEAGKKRWEREGSPWYNFFEEIGVRPVEPDEARELVERPIGKIFKLDSGVVDGKRPN